MYIFLVPEIQNALNGFHFLYLLGTKRNPGTYSVSMFTVNKLGTCEKSTVKYLIPFEIS